MEQQGADYLGYGDYQNRCCAVGITDVEDQKLLAGFLNDLGTMLNYADQMPLEQTHILNPSWVTQGVYAVVLAKELAERQGVFDDAFLATLLNDPKHNGQYPQEAQKFIREMMLTFKLCHEISHSGQHRRYLVPNALRNQPPDEVTKGFEDALRFEIRFPRILPTSVMSRFIVAMHSKRREDKRWRLGLCSETGGHAFLVTAHPKERCIRIYVGGTGPTRARVLEVIRHQFIKICREKEGLGAQEWTFPPDCPDAEGVSFDLLLEAEREKEEFLFLGKGIGRISVREWLDGVTLPVTRAKMQKVIQESKNQGGEGGRSVTYIIDKVERMEAPDMSEIHDKSVKISNSTLTNSPVAHQLLLQNAYNTIQTAPNGDVKAALEHLHTEVAKLLTCPEITDKETIKDDLESFAKEAVKAQPRSRLLEVTGDGLIEAAKTTAVMAPFIITAIQKVLSLFV